MSPVAAVTDTTGYLPADVVRDNSIHIVSLYVNFGGERTEREADITDYGRFFEELRRSEQLPTTSQPAVGDFIGVYEPLLTQDQDIVSVHISGGLSGTVDAARQAAQALEGKGGERVHLFDSETGAGGTGILALVAARAAQRGESAEQIMERLRGARADLKIWFAIDTLEYLRRGGRIGAASAWIGSTLKIKPILTVEREMTPVERVRTSKRAFERMVDYAKQRHSSGADAWVVQHIQSPDQAAELTARCTEIFGTGPLFVSEIGPVLGVHTGPGLLGVGGIPPHWLD
ncbi:MAG TPA: DegV family protein [Thermoleophilaceae bacterium]